MSKEKELILNKKEFIFDENISFIIIHKKIPLKLRSSFGTSHSSTTIRYNSFIQIIYTEKNKNLKYYGLGESGLPPKKPGCYLADNNDIRSYINEYFNFITSNLNNENMNIIIEKYFHWWRTYPLHKLDKIVK